MRESCFLVSIPLEVYPLEVYPLEVYPLEIYPLEIYPLEVYPIEVYPLEVYPLGVYPIEVYPPEVYPLEIYRYMNCFTVYTTFDHLYSFLILYLVKPLSQYRWHAVEIEEASVIVKYLQH